MKTSNYHGMRRISFLFGLLILSLLFSSCPDTKGEEPPEKRKSAIPISIQFLNADTSSDVEPQEVTVEIYDRDSLVHTPIGNQSSLYTIENGFLSLVIRSNKSSKHEREIPIALPYRFTIKISSKGYLEKTQTVIIDEYQTVYVPVFMMPLDDMPAGSSFGQTTGVLGDNAVTKEDIKVFTQPSPRSGDKGISAAVFIEEGTQLYGACKKYSEKKGDCKERCKEGYCKYPITGTTDSVKINFYQFDPRFEASANAFPNGFLVTDALDNQGQPLADLQNRIFFSSLGYINLSMLVGEEEVMGFSKPVTMEMEVPSDLTDPITGLPIQQNFQVPVWSLNATTGQWTSEDDISLSRKNGKLSARFEMDHLSTWNLDQKEDVCPPTEPIAITIDNKTRGFRARYAEFSTIGGSSTQFFSPTNTNNVLLLPSNKEYELNVINAPDISSGGEGLQFKLYNTVRKADGVDTSLNNIVCGDSRPIDLTMDESECVRFKFEILCRFPDPDDNFCFYPNLTGLWYQNETFCDPDVNDCGDPYLYYAGAIMDGEIDLDMSEIEPSPTPSHYTFKVQFDGIAGTADGLTFTILYNTGWDEDTDEDPSVIVDGPTTGTEDDCKTYIIKLTPPGGCAPDNAFPRCS